MAARRTVSTEEQESLQLMLRTLEQMNGSVALGFSGEDQLLGVLVLRDERLREAYSTDEIELFRGVATTIGITLQNSQVYERMKERDRLAALGQMAAGLAHEIRNPLGSIKGAAQFLQPAQTADKTATAMRRGRARGPREFLDIIVEEVNRLNKIVSQFLDYARPYRGEQRPLEVADVLKKTLSLLPKEKETRAHVEIVTTFAERLPPVRADAEQLLQVFLNLSLNALQAMARGRAGKLLISTALRRATRRGARPPSSRSASATPASASRPAISRTSSSRSSRPRTRGRAWGCPSASASSRTTAGRSRCARSRGRGRPSRCCCPIEATPTRPTWRRPREAPPPARRPTPPAAAAARRRTGTRQPPPLPPATRRTPAARRERG